MVRNIERDAFVVCFVTGTWIECPGGPQRVETLQTGDPVETRDRGVQPIRWISRMHRHAAGKAAPVRFETGSLGPDIPASPLSVSQQHRMLVRSAIARRMFGSAEVLVPAGKLIGLPGVSLCDSGQPVVFYHLMLDRHEIIFANGAPAESFLPGPVALDAISVVARRIAGRLSAPGSVPVRPIVEKTPRIRRLIDRHQRHDRVLVS